MAQIENPAFKAFVDEIAGDFTLAQVLVRRGASGFELRHVQDQNAAMETLKQITVSEVQQIAQFTAKGAFRPLKSAPNLQAGWVLIARDTEELNLALNHLYPNAVADRFLTTRGRAPVTNYREFTGRQTGMYRITTMLDDTRASEVIRVCCDRKFCLKRRLWSVEGLATDAAAEKSVIPCLEPCAVLLEFARKGMRIEQEEKTPVALSPSDAASIEAALEMALEHPKPDVREADFNAPDNPRRLALALEKLRASGIKLANAPEHD